MNRKWGLAKTVLAAWWRLDDNLNSCPVSLPARVAGILMRRPGLSRIPISTLMSYRVMDNYNYFESPIGLIELGGTPQALTAVLFVEENREDAASNAILDEAARAVGRLFRR